MTIDQGTRQKTITWQDPLTSAELGRTMAGLDFLRAMAEGSIPGPPIAAHLGMRLDSVAEGEVVFTLTPDESLYNPIGSVHGGVAATALDSALACAVHSTLPAGVGYTSVELKISFVRAITAGAGELRALGRVIKSGSRIAFAEGELRDGQGRLLATASTTCLVIRP